MSETYTDSIYMPSESIIVKEDNTVTYVDNMNSLGEKIEHEHENDLFVNLWRRLK